MTQFTHDTAPTQYVEADGIRFAYRRFGAPERTPLVFFQHFMGTLDDHDPALSDAFATDREVILFNNTGVASSSGLVPDTIEAMARDAISLIDALGLTTVDLVGHSMGGLIAREAALLPAGRFLSLTLLGSGPGAIAGQRAAVLREVLSVLDPRHGRDGDDRAQLSALIAQLWREQLEPQARDDGTDERIIAFLRERTHRNCPIGIIAMARYLLTCPDRTDELAALARPPSPSRPPRLPVMVIYGENDDAWPPVTQDRMARRLAAERACIPGAAHSPAVEAPETTARALTTFWNAAERRRVAKSH